jgi:hypothetical protein
MAFVMSLMPAILQISSIYSNPVKSNWRYLHVAKLEHVITHFESRIKCLRIVRYSEG